MGTFLLWLLFVDFLSILFVCWVRWVVLGRVGGLDGEIFFAALFGRGIQIVVLLLFLYLGLATSRLLMGSYWSLAIRFILLGVY